MKENISVVLIAHNEEATVGKMVEGLFANYDREILETLVVDDASTDRTAEVVTELQKRYPKLKLVKRTPPCGVGRALKTGFQHASSKADFLLTLDSDFVDNIGELRAMMDAMENGYDGVIGSRFISGSRLLGYPLEKKMMNRLFHLIVRNLFQIKQKDLTNNLKLYRRHIFSEMPWKSDDFSLNAETGILPIVSGYRIQEVPVSWVERRPGMGKSKFGILKHGLGYARVILHVFNYLRTRDCTRTAQV